jgi:hypothetical protein
LNPSSLAHVPPSRHRRHRSPRPNRPPAAISQEGLLQTPATARATSISRRSFFRLRRGPAGRGHRLCHVRDGHVRCRILSGSSPPLILYPGHRSPPHHVQMSRLPCEGMPPAPLPSRPGVDCRCRPATGSECEGGRATEEAEARGRPAVYIRYTTYVYCLIQSRIS